MASPSTQIALSQNLADAFSNFRAEHYKAGLLHHFTRPGYFPELVTRQPCFLIGGRGTGKTTTLRSLSYKGQFELCNRAERPIKDWGYIGLYLKVNTGRVASFRGPEVTEAQWERIFGHYLNLLFTIAILEFFEWYERTHPNQLGIPGNSLNSLRASFGLLRVGSISEVLLEVNSKLIEFESIINSIGTRPNLTLTPLGAPFEALLDSVESSNLLSDTTFFFLIDEFENLSNYQQRVLNTLIKHARPPYTFKIGVKELGIRERCTLNSSEQLIDPADFRRIDISERLSRAASFEDFASEVCARRIAALPQSGDVSKELIPELFE